MFELEAHLPLTNRAMHMVWLMHKEHIPPVVLRRRMSSIQVKLYGHK